MSDVVATPTDELGGLSLYQADQVIPEYVSIGSEVTGSQVGSSVSQGPKPTIEMNADMVNNAMEVINRLQQKVFYFLFMSIVVYN